MRSVIHLPYPRISGKFTLEEVLLLRRSVREFDRRASITLEELGQLLWAGQGLSEPRRGFRTCPSAGATYPLVLYAVVPEGRVSGLQAGVYRYIVETHSLELVKPGDHYSRLYRACLDQKWVYDAAVNIIIAADYDRTCLYYGERGIRYVILEAGHACQNIYLQATALGLGAVAIGAFYDDEIEEIICAVKEKPLYVIAIGKPRLQIFTRENAQRKIEELIRYYSEKRHE